MAALCRLDFKKNFLQRRNDVPAEMATDEYRQALVDKTKLHADKLIEFVKDL
ncbi:MAG: hypothetical protein IJ685_02320 [Selenomonadaceae bacterium]|nr:hypothetical protein [Selenomonadaceae bacterium]